MYSSGKNDIDLHIIIIFYVGGTCTCMYTCTSLPYLTSLSNFIHT